MAVVDRMKAGETCVIGAHGLIGGALARRLHSTPFPTAKTKIVFHFGSYSHQAFERNEQYFIRQQIDGFMQLLPYCAERAIQFVYPSSALVYEKDSTFARFKKTLEQLAGCYPAKTLGLRIFPVYGPGEDRTVIAQWCRAMSRGEPPVVFGDGCQARDFIFVEDVVDQILMAAEAYRHASRIVDIGTGILTSFNEIVELINRELGSRLEPTYVRVPFGYSEGIACPDPLPAKTSIRAGIRRILETCQ